MNVNINCDAQASLAAGQAVSACGAGVRPTNVVKRERQPAMKQEGQGASLGIPVVYGGEEVKKFLLRKLTCKLNYYINKTISAFGLCPKCFRGLSANKHQLFCTSPDCKFRTSKLFQ